MLLKIRFCVNVQNDLGQLFCKLRITDMHNRKALWPLLACCSQYQEELYVYLELNSATCIWTGSLYLISFLNQSEKINYHLRLFFCDIRAMKKIKESITHRLLIFMWQSSKKKIKSLCLRSVIVIFICI